MKVSDKNRVPKTSLRTDNNISLSAKDKRALYNLKALAKMMKKNEEPPKIDETMSKKIGSDFDLVTLFKSLKMSGNSMINEVRQDYSSKHFSAICGCYVEEMSPKSPTVEAVNESVDLPSSILEAKEPIKSDETPSPPRHCRYCKSNVDAGNVTCNDCRRFLNSFCLNLDRLEDAFCIKVPTCITAESPGSSQSFPSSWCKACRVLHCVKLGFRPHSSHKRKSKHRSFLDVFYPTRLSQDKFLLWARSKRCVEYISNKLKSPITIETHSPCELSFFLDRLWCRALPSNSSSSSSDDPNIDSSSIPCQFCSTLCSDAYGITLGPSRSSDHPEVKVCGSCVLRCRTTAVRVAEQTSPEEGDSLGKRYSASDFLSLCECSTVGAKCDFCFTAGFVTLLRDQLMSSSNEVFCNEFIPLGSPLFFGCCRLLPGIISREDKGIESRLIHDNLPCAVCRKTSGNIFQLNNKTIVCEDCVLGFKTVFTLLSVRAKDQHPSDLVLLANLVALPCNASHPTNQAPLWAICLQCHARRCLRLLHPLEPSLDLPPWLKRRARLVFYRASTPDKTITICDLDPTISITTRQHKRSKRLRIVTDSATRAKLLENVGTSLLLLDNLTVPAVDEAQSTFTIDESSDASSLDSGSESESEHEEKENVVDNATEASNAPVSPKEEVGSAGLRDRRSRRLTTRYAEALKAQTTKRRRPRDDSESAGGTLRSLSSPAVTNSTIGEEDEENQSGHSRPHKRQRMAESPEKIIEGKRKPKANVRFQGDFAVLGPLGKWESGGVVYPSLDDVRSDISSASAQNRRQIRRQQTAPQTGRSGPRVKMVNRKPPPNNQLNSPMSIMKHAAKLAAVGVQRQDGTSPFMAASAATAEAYLSDTSSADGCNRLKADCGNCAACRGLAAPCGRCVNCRKQAHYGGVGSSLKSRPCIGTICQRRRRLMLSKLEGPRVKIPSKLSPRSYQKSKVVPRSAPALSGLPQQPSLFETVPGLEDQIMNIASPLLRCDSPPSKSTRATESDDQGSVEENSPTNFVSTYPTRSRDVYADAPVRSLRGGDLGMFFESRDSTNEDMTLRSVVPVEGEVIDANIAHRGGFPVITTAAAAPPKEICYLCGSAGVELQYCKICAEPYHAFCDRFQTITKSDKKNFICSNCIRCDVCKHPGVELRCSKCLRGYHPVCVSNYAPHRNGDKCKFICPRCTECVHCLITPYGDYPEKIRSYAEKEIIVPWSRNPTKCMDCSKAESKGDVCPVCNRPYGSQPLELIRCDSCGQWMHTACAQFSPDQFELMRLYPRQLRNYIILCTVCEPNAERFLKANKNNKKQLSLLMSLALTVRMNALEAICKLPPTGDTYHYSQPSATLAIDRRSFPSVSHIEYTGSHRFMYQMDGIDDDYSIKEEEEEEEDEEYEEFEEDLSPIGHVLDDTNRERRIPSWLMHDELSPPPAKAEWLLEKLRWDFWITPKTLSFMLMARVIARMERTPASASDYVPLRKLLTWLSNSVQILFPWLDSPASVKEVQALLRQRQGSLLAVEEFLRSVAEIELYEFACPFVTALTCQARRMNICQANQLNPVLKIGFYQACIDKVRRHVRMHHPDFPSCNRTLRAAQDAFIKKRCRNERCCHPTLLPNIPDEIITDATEEVNFQKELFLNCQRLLHCPSQRVVLSALLDGGKMPYYFGVKSDWESLSKAYASQMVPIPSNSSVDLDESDSETPEIRALPEKIIDREEKAMFDPAVEPRRCLLCARNTDTSIEDRLIYIGSDIWVHVNCALWSKEVFEEDSGQLTGLSAALRRGCRSYCKDCGRPGATMTCSNTSFCDVVVHFPCAMSRRRPTHSEPIFTAGRCFFCSPECYATVKSTRYLESVKRLRMKKVETLYKDEEELVKVKAAIKEDKRELDDLIADREITQEEVGSVRSEVDWEMASPELREMLVYRRVFVPSDCFVVSLRDDGFDLEAQNSITSSDENDDNGQDPCDEKRPGQSILSLATSKNTFAFASYKLPASAFVVTIGALRIDRLGYIAEASDSLCREKANYLCPVGYRARRFFWSTVDPNFRTPYILTIEQALKESSKAENSPGMSQYSHAPASRPKGFSAKRTVQSPIAPKPITPLKMVPTLSVAGGSPNSAFDPYPNSPPGLPLIRFTYTQNISAGRQNQRTSASAQQSSMSAPQSRVVTASSQRVVTPLVLQTQPSISVQSITPVQSVSITSMIPPTSKPVNLINTSSGSLFTNITSSDQKGQSLIITKPSVSPALVAAPKFSSVPFLSKASTPRIVGAVSLSRPPAQQTPITTAPILSSSVSRIPTSGTTTVVQIPTPVNVVQKRTAVQAQLSPPPTNPGKRPVNVYQHMSTGSVLTASPGTPQSPRPSIFIRAPVLNPPRAIGSALRPVRFVTSKPVYTISAPDRSPPSIVAANPPTGPRLIRPPISPQTVRQAGMLTLLQSPKRQSESQDQKRENPSQEATIRQLDGMDDSDEFVASTGSRGSSARQKRKWMTDQESRRALQESVQKARQVANERVYQKEAALFANSFQLEFSARPSKEVFLTPASTWHDVVSAVAESRKKRAIPFPDPPIIDGWTQFGLNHRHVIFLLEQLPGAHTCLNYQFRYHRYRIDQIREKYEPPQSHIHGAARLIPFKKDPKRSEMARDPLEFLLCKANRAPRSCLPLDWPPEKNGRARGSDNPPSTTMTTSRWPSACIDAARQAASIVANSLNIPPRLHARTVEAVVVEATADMVEEAEAGCSKQLLSLTHQLRNIPTNREARMWRVAVCPSRIHKRGLFALCSFRPGELICEYTGELVTNMVCDRREAMYRSKGVDCYFFRISENLVVDATYAGNYARFINHSCQPNCGAQIVGKDHIVIVANRRILPGEELTYDYQFPKEMEKLTCNCGRIGCRRYLN
ncbi:hypothetical protein Aperf_G00000071186 [Anoplocephala perfoliata]